MSSSAPKTLALQEIEPPAALAEALTVEFLRPLRIENPPAVQLMPLEKWGGFCRGLDFTQEGEVVLASSRWTGAEVERFRETYLHEITHRFLSAQEKEKIGGSHGPVFFALQLLLFLRAGEREGGHPWAWQANLYDLHDCFEDHPYTPGQAFDWAYRQAEKLADQEITAEGAAGEIVLRFSAWHKEMIQAPDRRKAKADREQALARKAAAAKWWVCYSGLFGVLFGVLWGICVGFWVA